jgi:hypothetical protein
MTNNPLRSSRVSSCGFATTSRLTSAAFRLPFVLGLRIADCPPLHVVDRIGTATGERHDVIFDVTRAGAVSAPG